ncbi:putative kinesin [Anopheles sinensis]|uniref:Putative kinesin n=1 Tax=Anopheles sinensis TaxID=74873 RepID=A0A084WRE4_ANOSI|nr:putative kinesin [Anopheles sinensis]
MDAVIYGPRAVVTPCRTRANDIVADRRTRKSRRPRVTGRSLSSADGERRQRFARIPLPVVTPGSYGLRTVESFVPYRKS